MPFKRGKSHIITLSQAYVAAFLQVQAFRAFLHDLTHEIITEGAFYSDTGPTGPWKQVADRVSMATFAAQYIDNPAVDDPSGFGEPKVIIWTSRNTLESRAWRFSFYQGFLERMDDLSLSQAKKRQRGAFVRRRGGELDVAQAVPIRIRIPHK